jgi:hypothetical protein
LLTMPCGVGMAAKANCKLATVLPATAMWLEAGGAPRTAK